MQCIQYNAIQARGKLKPVDAALVTGYGRGYADIAAVPRERATIGQRQNHAL